MPNTKENKSVETDVPKEETKQKWSPGGNPLSVKGSLDTVHDVLESLYNCVHKAIKMVQPYASDSVIRPAEPSDGVELSEFEEQAHVTAIDGARYKMSHLASQLRFTMDVLNVRKTAPPVPAAKDVLDVHVQQIPAGNPSEKSTEGDDLMVSIETFLDRATSMNSLINDFVIMFEDYTLKEEDKGTAFPEDKEAAPARQQQVPRVINLLDEIIESVKGSQKRIETFMKELL